MRLNWFSPLPPARTDVANYTTRVLPALCARGLEIKVWSSHPDYDPGRLPPRVAHGPGHALRLPWPEINFREHSVYQVGNDIRFHGPILGHLEQHGGIVVLHDTNVHEAQRMRLLDREGGVTGYLAMLGAEGGDRAMRDGRRHLEGNLAVERMVERYPLTGSVLRGAHGVVVHHRGAAERVRSLTPAPVACLPLPYSPPHEWPERAPKRWDGQRPLRLVMFGFLHGPNRRLPQILKAIAVCASRRRFRLDLFGELGQPERLAQHVAELGLEGQVHFHGFVAEERMTALLQEADLALNLRHPTRGEASGSLLRIWSHALPCVVSDSGVYGTLPSDTVIRIAPDDEEIINLAATLDRFAADPESFSAIGRRGRAHLAAHHTPTQYAAGLLEFLPLVEAYRGRAVLDRYLPRLSQEVIAELPAPAAQDYWTQRLAEILVDAFPAS